MLIAILVYLKKRLALKHKITPELRAIDAINPMDLAFKEAIAGGVTTVSTGPGSANVIGGWTVLYYQIAW